MSRPIKRIAFLSTAVTPYSETRLDYASYATVDCLRHYAEALAHLGVKPTLLLPAGSDSRFPHVLFEGELQGTLAESENASRQEAATAECLKRMVEWALQHQDEFDLIVNMGHDFLPFAKMGDFTTPYVMLPNLVETTPVVDAMLRDRARRFPLQVWFFSAAQRALMGVPENPLIAQPFDTSLFAKAVKPSEGLAPYEGLAWAGRIVPEKGLDNALAIAAVLDRPLFVAGPVHDLMYFDALCREYKDTLVYKGLLPRDEFYQLLSHSEAFLQTQHEDWQEAFGRVTAEAMLAGCPVLYYDSGANAELVQAVMGGDQLARGRGGELEAFLKVQSLDRNLIQANASRLFDHHTVAMEFLLLAGQLTS